MIFEKPHVLFAISKNGLNCLINLLLDVKLLGLVHVLFDIVVVSSDLVTSCRDQVDLLIVEFIPCQPVEFVDNSPVEIFDSFTMLNVIFSKLCHHDRLFSHVICDCESHCLIKSG